MKVMAQLIDEVKKFGRLYKYTGTKVINRFQDGKSN